MKGSCLCGTVAFEAEPPAEGLRIGLCSCPSCRKAHAALTRASRYGAWSNGRMCPAIVGPRG